MSLSSSVSYHVSIISWTSNGPQQVVCVSAHFEKLFPFSTFAFTVKIEFVGDGNQSVDGGRPPQRRIYEHMHLSPLTPNVVFKLSIFSQSPTTTNTISLSTPVVGVSRDSLTINYMLYIQCGRISIKMMQCSFSYKIV